MDSKREITVRGAVKLVVDEAKSEKAIKVSAGDKGKKADKPKVSSADTAQRGQQFFRGVWSELKKVHWSTPRELAVFTSVVVVATIIVAFLIWVVDIGLSAVISSVLPK